MTTKKKGTADDLDKYVGAKIKEIRLIKGITQEKLGDAIGVTFQQLQKYENGKNRISSSRVHQVSKFLGVSLYAFYPDEETGGEPFTKLQLKILKAFHWAQPDNLKDIQTLARVLKP